MGLETALIAATVVSAGSSIYSGIQQNKMAKRCDVPKLAPRAGSRI